MKLGKRALVRIISFGTALVLAVFGSMLSTEIRLKKYETQIGYTYSMNLDELDGSLYNISIALQKSLYASSPTQLNSLAVELCTESTVAKNALSQLPMSGMDLSRVNKFLSQVGDYTYYLSKKAIRGEEIPDDDRENLHSLAKTAQSVSASVNAIRTEYDRDGVWKPDIAVNIENSVDDGLASNFDGLEELLTDYPTLIYDGPFSDHMLEGNMKMLSGKAELSADEALKKGCEILGVEVIDFKQEADTAGNVACYNFSDGQMTFSVTKKGGCVIYMRKLRDIGEAEVSYEEAVEIAEEYLNSVGNVSFQSTYYFSDEGICTVNLAHKEGATLCYPDLIKVGVALDTGEVLFVEAGGYLANHYTRTISTPKYSVDEARSKLSKSLKINGVKRCIIPTDGNTEKHCYEFNCIGLDNEELLVYMNVETLEEEQILLVLKTDGGSLTK